MFKGFLFKVNISTHSLEVLEHLHYVSISYSLTILILNIEMTHLNQPWSLSVAVTFNTVVPGPWFSITWASNSARWNTGASSFTSITCTDSTWEVESWGIPWSSATMVRLKTSCSSRSKAFRMEREPTKEKKLQWAVNENFLKRSRLPHLKPLVSFVLNHFDVLIFGLEMRM